MGLSLNVFQKKIRDGFIKESPKVILFVGIYGGISRTSNNITEFSLALNILKNLIFNVLKK